MLCSTQIVTNLIYRINCLVILIFAAVFMVFDSRIYIFVAASNQNRRYKGVW